jgi:hypothetical protein
MIQLQKVYQTSSSASLTENYYCPAIVLTMQNVFEFKDKENKKFKCLSLTPFWLSLSRKQGKSIYTLLHLKSQHNHCKKNCIKIRCKNKNLYIFQICEILKLWFLLVHFPKKKKKRFVK